MMNKKFLFLAFGIALLAVSCNQATPLYSDGSVVLAGQTVNVDVVADEKSRSLGLGRRTALNETQGMWFEFASADQYKFWMKDMNFPIDIIWINQGIVVDITRNAPVQNGVADSDLMTYAPLAPADRVLELRAGWADHYGLKVGDQAQFHLKP